MAFNFNWSPLIADTSRAREMLTAALNKSPKPPIIVDDIIVTELNLGAIGDLAEDRFRGIFKMTYSGDAFLTLKTRVQANPLNTYLSTKPSFASPQPLAAADGLTIPLQITLSDIRLSGFVILVFSRHKGLTLVFRNDPLESLKVSSTFDSIPFVRDYLQKEIEKQLRVLFMEDLPAILHRLSLRLWSPEYREMDEMVNNAKRSGTETPAPVDPFASPPQDPVDLYGNPLDDSQISSVSLDSSSEIHASFSQKNLLRLGALNDSHRTLSLFTPSIRDTVFRAWASSADRAETSGANTFHPLTSSTLSRVHSASGIMSPGTYSISEGTDNGSILSRPTLASSNSTYSSLGLGGGRSRAHAQRKAKRRVVNLRRNKDGADTESVATNTTTPEPSVEASENSSVIPEEREEDLMTPPTTPPRESGYRTRRNTIEKSPAPATVPSAAALSKLQDDEQEYASTTNTQHSATSSLPLRSFPRDVKTPFAHSYNSSAPSNVRLQGSALPYSEAATSGGILEQAWMMKMANEIARKVRDEKEREARQASFWDRRDEEEMEAPPAYAA
ncbi:mitochondrial distribution and morphology protein 34 [Macrophomina phaseolina]|uniref:Mitochondrial distribution and morphology protein 34 n=1 Tax=Macrophomina phaseolina TaxID=35725 RepID=A0ABQ8GPZ8_9PEZI|nr:mitochondrial distribution and morphology protein 34 [Macrophomina phaseolina]